MAKKHPSPYGNMGYSPPPPRRHINIAPILIGVAVLLVGLGLLGFFAGPAWLVGALVTILVAGGAGLLLHKQQGREVVAQGMRTAGGNKRRMRARLETIALESKDPKDFMAAMGMLQKRKELKKGDTNFIALFVGVIAGIIPGMIAFHFGQILPAGQWINGILAFSVVAGSVHTAVSGKGFGELLKVGGAMVGILASVNILFLAYGVAAFTGVVDDSPTKRFWESDVAYEERVVREAEQDAEKAARKAKERVQRMAVNTKARLRGTAEGLGIDPNITPTLPNFDADGDGITTQEELRAGGKKLRADVAVNAKGAWENTAAFMSGLTGLGGSGSSSAPVNVPALMAIGRAEAMAVDWRANDCSSTAGRQGTTVGVDTFPYLLKVDGEIGAPACLVLKWGSGKYPDLAQFEQDARNCWYQGGVVVRVKHGGGYARECAPDVRP
jgi:hypothetical protein